MNPRTILLYEYRTVTANTLVQPSDDVILVNGDASVTMYDPALRPGHTVLVKNVGDVPCNVMTTGNTVMDQSTSLTLYPYWYVMMTSDGSVWRVVYAE